MLICICVAKAKQHACSQKGEDKKQLFAKQIGAWFANLDVGGQPKKGRPLVLQLKRQRVFPTPAISFRVFVEHACCDATMIWNLSTVWCVGPTPIAA